MIISFSEAVPLLLGAASLFLGVGKYFLDRLLSAVEKRFDHLDQVMADRTSEFHELKEEFLQLKAELPVHYVRREDDIRNQTLINAKLDALYQKIEELKEKQ